MNLLVALLIVVGLALLYFFIGAVIKFIIGWWILIFAVPVAIAIGSFGIGWAFLALILIGLATIANNEWHSCSIYFKIEEKVERIFYFHDV